MYALLEPNSYHLSDLLPPLQGSDGEKAFAGQVLVSVLEAVRIVAVLLSPVTPCLSERIYLQLGFSEKEFEVGVLGLGFTSLHCSTHSCIVFTRARVRVFCFSDLCLMLDGCKAFPFLK